MKGSIMTNNRNWNGIRAAVAEYCKDNNISDSDFRFLNLFEWQNIYNNVLDTFLDYKYAKYNGLYWSNVENGFKKSITRLFCFQEGAKDYPSYEWIMKLPQIIGSDMVYGTDCIRFVSHDDEDGKWQFLCGREHETEDARLVSLESIFEIDNSVGELADMPCGHQAERDTKSSIWNVS